MGIYFLQIVRCLVVVYYMVALCAYADSNKPNIHSSFYPYQELVLTSEQKKIINLFYKDMTHDRYSEISSTERSNLNRELINLIESKDLKESELVPLINQIAKIKAIDLMNQVRVQHKIWQILTDDQKRYIQRMRELMNIN